MNHAEIKWLTDTNIENFKLHDELGDTLRYPIPMPNDVGHGSVEIYHLPLDMTLSRGTHHFTNKMKGKFIPFAELIYEFDTPTISIQAARYGCVIVNDREAKKELTFGDRTVYFHHFKKMNIEPVLDASSTVEVTMLHVAYSSLEILLGKKESQLLINALKLDSIPSTHTVDIPSFVTAPFFNSLDNPLTSSIGKLYAQSQVLEFLSSLSNFLLITPSENTLSPCKNKIITRLKEELLFLEGKAPQLEDLAKRYKISARTLNNDFKTAYGKSIFQFVCEHRLKLAHQAITSTTTPLKVIANNLGYTHVNHFIAAFSKQFGVTPGKLRKQ